MSEENVQVVRRGLAVWDGSVDFDTALQTFDEAAVIRRHSPLPDPLTATGRVGILDVIVDWIEDFDEFKMWGEEHIDAGDHVVVRVVQAARGAGSGVPVQRDFWFVYELRGGKVIRLDMYASRSQALGAVGLQE